MATSTKRTRTTLPDIESLTASIEELVRAGDTRRLSAVHGQLKSAVDRKRVADRTRRYASNPVGWVRRRLRQIVWSKQKEILEAVRDHRRIAVRSGHGVGKATSHPWSPRGGWTRTSPGLRS